MRKTDHIIGRGIEWNNHKNIILSLSELVVYSGINRPIDFAYLNPLSSHLEIELNDRQNKICHRVAPSKD